MVKIYRITPLRDKWIVQRVSDRKQIGKSFEYKSEAAAYELELLVKAPKANGKLGTKTIFQAYEKFAAYKKNTYNTKRICAFWICRSFLMIQI